MASDRSHHVTEVGRHLALAAGGIVPVALLGYWFCNALWTMGQSAVIWRWFPTPGSAAAARLAGDQGSA